MNIEDDAITEVNRASVAGRSYEQINAVALLSIAISQKRIADALTKVEMNGTWSIHEAVQTYMQASQ